MILNFGHTFAHAIEVQNRYSTKITHGEAVLSGMILDENFCYKKICSAKTLNRISNIYFKNNLSYNLKTFLQRFITRLIPYLKNDKKYDDKINFIY